MPTFVHPISGERFRGRKIVTGATLKKGDRYDSASGHWETYSPTSPGERLASTYGTWVRPYKRAHSPIHPS